MKQPRIHDLAVMAKELGADAIFVVAFQSRTGAAKASSWAADPYLCLKVEGEVGVALSRVEHGEMKVSHRRIRSPKKAPPLLLTRPDE